jgi:hypothetical protein
MKDFVKRMIKERDELYIKMEKLRTFYAEAEEENPALEMKPIELKMLWDQLQAMETYYRILNSRIGIHIEIEE